MKGSPLFSVLMPVFQVSAVWLKRAIESLRRQTLPDWEICIVDDESASCDVSTGAGQREQFYFSRSRSASYGVFPRNAPCGRWSL